jgi:hypothetical protein
MGATPQRFLLTKTARFSTLGAASRCLVHQAHLAVPKPCPPGTASVRRRSEVCFKTGSDDSSEGCNSLIDRQQTRYTAVVLMRSVFEEKAIAQKQ